MKKFLLIATFILTSTMLFACAKTVAVDVTEQSTKNNEKTEQAEKKASKTEPDLNRFINDVLLTHYDEQFGYTENLYKTTGYKILGKENINENELRVYVLANYMEYEDVNGDVKEAAGSGVTALALTINLKGMGSRVDYEVLTDHDIGSEKYNEAFPEDIRKKINPISESDRKEVVKKQEEMLKEQVAEETGEELEGLEEEETEEE